MTMYKSLPMRNAFMTSTRTVEDLAKELLGSTVMEAFDKVEVMPIGPEDEEAVLTVDEILAQYVSSTTTQALSEVDIHDEHVACEITVEQFEAGPIHLGRWHFKGTIQGLSVLVVVLIGASLLVGVDAVISLLQALSSLLA